MHHDHRPGHPPLERHVQHHLHPGHRRLSLQIHRDYQMRLSGVTIVYFPSGM